MPPPTRKAVANRLIAEKRSGSAPASGRTSAAPLLEPPHDEGDDNEAALLDDGSAVTAFVPIPTPLTAIAAPLLTPIIAPTPLAAPQAVVLPLSALPSPATFQPSSSGFSGRIPAVRVRFGAASPFTPFTAVPTFGAVTAGTAPTIAAASAAPATSIKPDGGIGGGLRYDPSTGSTRAVGAQPAIQRSGGGGGGVASSLFFSSPGTSFSDGDGGGGAGGFKWGGDAAEKKQRILEDEIRQRARQHDARERLSTILALKEASSSDNDVPALTAQQKARVLVYQAEAAEAKAMGVRIGSNQTFPASGFLKMKFCSRIPPNCIFAPL